MNKTILIQSIILPLITISCYAESWEKPLQKALETCNEIRVRSGGTCHRNTEDEKLLFKVSGTNEIKEVVQSIEIVEERSGFHCMCCGDPTLEFYDNDKLVVSLAYHHGQSLRWFEGKWEGDAMLTPESMEKIAQWISDNGITEPLEELRLNQKRERAMMNRYAKYSAIIPEELESLWQMAQSEEDMINALDQVVPEKTSRTVLLFKLYGCDFGGWNASNCLDEFIVAQLEEIDTPTLWNAIQKSQTDQQSQRGAARWVIAGLKEKDISSELLMPVLRDLSTVGLTHPRRICRERTVAFLEKHPCKTSTKLLFECLSGEFEVMMLPQEEEIEPGGMVTFWPRDKNLSDECSERAYAALVLAKIGNKSIEPIVEDLIKTAPDNDKVVYEASLAIRKKHIANQKLDPTLKTPGESGKEQGSAGQL